MAILNRALSTSRSIERQARLVMGSLAILAALLGLSLKADLIRSAPDYDRQSWYLVSQHQGFMVTTLTNDEAACRKRQAPDATCHSGSSMADHPRLADKP